jgi:hypothetical protein
MTNPHWTTYLAALLMPTIAVFGAIIAYRQWRTAQNKLKFDLFERRLAVYETVKGYISSVMATGRTAQEKEFEFLSDIRGAKWLFDEDIVHYLEKDMWQKICALSCVQSELEDMPSGEERSRKIQVKGALVSWFAGQLEILDTKFSPFLLLRH